LLFDPYRKEALVPLMKPPEAIYSSLGFLTARERREALANYSREVGPVSDDKPFFYRLDKEDFFVSSLFFSTPLAFVFLIVTGSIVLFSWPVRRMKKDQLSRSMRAYAGCFALAGFAFLLSEAAVIQMFSVFVGGPVYALAVVLVSVLAGYAGGSWLSQHLKIAPMTYVVLGLVLAALFSALYLCLPGLIHALMPLGDQNRILICALLTFLTYLITGIPVSLAMTAVKRSHGDVVAWMWGVSCASNAIGAMCFTLIAQATGISGAFIIVAVLYLLASVGFALLSYVQQGRPAPQAISAAGE
jgi:hypothetical protein